ncbi:MAG: nucleotidyltransferase family protein [Heliobacteriaceae bacterium]|nr:nucleotidyltransferase family protein [Heliobacteriaceae bacterium]
MTETQDYLGNTNVLTGIFTLFNKKSTEYLLEILVKKLYNDFVKEEDQKLLNLIFAESPSQQDLDNFLKVWDIEEKGGTASLMLSYLMKAHPELKFRDYETPRLKGLINFHRFANIKTLSYFSKVGKALNTAGIVPVLFKGAAMKALRPELSRVMNDVDILVPYDEFKQAVAVIEKFGFSAYGRHLHSFDMCTPDLQGQIDIHRFILMYDWNLKRGLKYTYSPEFNEKLFARARKVNAFGVDVLLPSNEDLAFIILTNLVKNMTAKSTVTGILFSLFDLQYLSQQENFDWQILTENSKLTNSELSIKIGAEFVEKIVRGLLPDKLRVNLPIEGHTKRECSRIVYNELYFLGFRDENRTLKLKNALRHPSLLLKYLAMKPKYVYMKSIRDNEFLVDLFLKRALSGNFVAAHEQLEAKKCA